MNHGIEFESQIHQICDKFFLPDLVFRNPSYVKGGRINRELADLVMPLHNTLIAFQVRSVQNEPNSEIRIQRFARRVDHAVGQFKTLREVLGRGETLSARSSRGMDIQLSLDSAKEVLAVLIVNHPLKNLSKSRADYARGFTEASSLPIHIFSHKDFLILARVLDTLPDLLGYLKMRRHILGRGKIVGGKGESSLLWLYLNRRQLLEEACLMERPTVFANTSGQLPRKVRTKEAVFHEKRRLGGVMTDHVLSVLHDMVATPETDIRPFWAREMTPPADIKTYWLLLQELASLSRKSREMLGEKLIEKMMKAEKTGHGYCLFVPNFKPVLEARERKSIMFGQDAVLIYTSKEPRKNRLERLISMTGLALDAYGLRQVIGITTDPWETEPRYFDFNLKRVEECEIVPAAKALAAKYFGQGYMEGEAPNGQTLQDLQKKYSRLRIYSPIDDSTTRTKPR